MQVRFFGGLSVSWGADEGAVPGRGQQALLLRLAVDAGTTVGYRALADDVWPNDAPEDPRAALQSLASRLRRALPEGLLASVPGGYRLELSRDDIDITRFQDLVADARAANDPGRARDALALWTGDPWIPHDGFDWLVRDLWQDRGHAERLAAAEPAPTPAPAPPVVPAAITGLVGRAYELDAIRERLSTDRLVTVIGPGGAGKTTLALETVRATADALVVELAPAASGEVWAAIAGAVGHGIRLNETAASAPTSPRYRVIEAVAGRDVVIVLDNCEHVIGEAAEVAQTLLMSTPGLRILATSREPLGVIGEAFVDLGPLPALDADELFARRVRSARGIPPAPDERDTAARIVQRLDGLPLAIELAAARARTLTLAEIDAGLSDRFALLAHGPRLSPDRHRTLRALIDWSWDTLTDPERVALRASSVFPDGIGSGDAAAIAEAFGVDATVFDALVDRSLVVRRDGRFRLLETVREYGLDRLRVEGAETEYRERAADVLTVLATDRERTMRGPGLRAGLAWFDANEENLSAALRTRTASTDRRPGRRLLRALLWAWAVRERIEELRPALAAFADPETPLDDEPSVVIESLALFSASFPEPGETPTFDPARFRARRLALEEAASRHPSEISILAAPLLRLAETVLRAQDSPAGRAWHVDVSDGEITSAPPWSRATLHMLRAGAAQNVGDATGLGVESERALRIFTEVGDPWGTGIASQLRSEWLILAGRLQEALAVSDNAARIVDGLSSVSDLLQMRAQSVGILLRLGRLDEARTRAADMESIAAADGSVRALSQARMAAAQVEISAGDGAAALRQSQAIRLEPGFPDQIRAWAGAQRAQALILLNRLDEARAALRDAVPLAVRSHDHPIVASVLVAVAGWNAAVGRPDRAREALERAAAVRGAEDRHEPFWRWAQERLGADIGEIPTSAPGIPLGQVDADVLTALLDEGPRRGSAGVTTTSCA
ncbi:ATP-binding protein [Microbacterium sp. T32]|uniref:ATP-binding protein n=2 Tax=Bacteria TaxID=2 RepID=UPI0007AC194C|nr:tetratricopeptide repeat protein [Microbacterium sp. T32]KZE39739.1 ATPase [Microbacterium sp. T32]